MRRMLLGTGVLLCVLLQQQAILRAQEPAFISGDLAVRFEQAPGFFHYAALCRTATEFSADEASDSIAVEIDGSGRLLVRHGDEDAQRRREGGWLAAGGWQARDFRAPCPVHSPRCPVLQPVCGLPSRRDGAAASFGTRVRSSRDHEDPDCFQIQQTMPVLRSGHADSRRDKLRAS